MHLFHKQYRLVNIFLGFSLVKSQLDDQILENLCEILSLPWIYSHLDDSSFSSDLLVLSQKIAHGFGKHGKHQNLQVFVHFMYLLCHGYMSSNLMWALQIYVQGTTGYLPCHICSNLYHFV